MLCKVYGSTDAKVTLLFCNGFGSDYHYWDKLLPLFSEYNCVMLTEDYFNEGKNVSDETLRELLENKYIIGIGHSLGYIKLCKLIEKYKFIHMQKIVAIEGFSRYLGGHPLIRNSRIFPLEQMRWNYAVNPIVTLVGFQMFCGEHNPMVPKDINKQLFEQDLDLLNYGIISPDIPHLVLSSIDDPVIPFYVIEDNFRKLPNVRISYTFGASHILGRRSPQWVYEEILNFIE